MKPVTLPATLIGSTHAHAFEKNALLPLIILQIRLITAGFNFVPNNKLPKSHTLQLKMLWDEWTEWPSMNSTYEGVTILFSKFYTVENLLRLNSLKRITLNHQLPWGYCISR